MPLTTASAGLVYEIILVDLVTLFLAVATVWIFWYVLKKIFLDEVRDARFFLTFIAVIIPFVMLIYFGLAVVNYDVMATRSGWPQALPLKPLSPPFDHLVGWRAATAALSGAS